MEKENKFRDKRHAFSYQVRCCFACPGEVEGGGLEKINKYRSIHECLFYYYYFFFFFFFNISFISRTEAFCEINNYAIATTIVFCECNFILAAHSYYCH